MLRLLKSNEGLLVAVDCRPDSMARLMLQLYRMRGVPPESEEVDDIEVSVTIFHNEEESIEVEVMGTATEVAATIEELLRLGEKLKVADPTPEPDPQPKVAEVPSTPSPPQKMPTIEEVVAFINRRGEPYSHSNADVARFFLSGSELAVGDKIRIGQVANSARNALSVDTGRDWEWDPSGEASGPERRQRMAPRGASQVRVTPRLVRKAATVDTAREDVDETDTQEGGEPITSPPASVATSPTWYLEKPKKGDPKEVVSIIRAGLSFTTFRQIVSDHPGSNYARVRNWVLWFFGFVGRNMKADRDGSVDLLASWDAMGHEWQHQVALHLLGRGPAPTAPFRIVVVQPGRTDAAPALPAPQPPAHPPKVRPNFAFTSGDVLEALNRVLKDGGEADRVAVDLGQDAALVRRWVNRAISSMGFDPNGSGAMEAARDAWREMRVWSREARAQGIWTATLPRSPLPT